jgi:hypothetical protein
MSAISNGVLANTHKELALGILMTMVPVLDEGVSSLSFHLEGDDQVVCYKYVRELLGFRKGAPGQISVHENMVEGFWGELERLRSPTWSLIGITWP